MPNAFADEQPQPDEAIRDATPNGTLETLRRADDVPTNTPPPQNHQIPNARILAVAPPQTLQL